MCGNVVNSSSYMLTKQASYVVGLSRFIYFFFVKKECYWKYCKLMDLYTKLKNTISSKICNISNKLVFYHWWFFPLPFYWCINILCQLKAKKYNIFSKWKINRTDLCLVQAILCSQIMNHSLQQYVLVQKIAK